MDKLLPHKRLHFSETESTHRYALQEAANLPDGTVITADFQRAGIGRQGRSWVSKPGAGILASVLLKASIAKTGANLLVHVIALSVADMMTNLGLTPSIKWPNDILICEKKVAGVMAESSLRGGEIEYAVLSAGINLNHTAQDLAGIDRPATSLMIESGNAVDVDMATDVFLSKLDDNLRTLLALGPAQIVERWKGYERMTGRSIKLDVGDKVLEGTVIGFDDTCAIEVEDETGQVMKFQSGEILSASR
jgi:BirA family biotin operon repressor/biotin-[acetyl-CoA-carboxylase] ligase